MDEDEFHELLSYSRALGRVVVFHERNQTRGVVIPFRGVAKVTRLKYIIYYSGWLSPAIDHTVRSNQVVFTPSNIV